MASDKAKTRASMNTIQAFLKAVWPEYTELQAASTTEDECLREATRLINGKRSPEPPAAAPVAWLGKVDQGMGHWHFEVADPNAENAFPVYASPVPAAAQGPTREELAEALRGCLNDDTGDWVDNAMDLLARHDASKGEPAEIGGGEKT